MTEETVEVRAIEVGGAGVAAMRSEELLEVSPLDVADIHQIGRGEN